MKKKILLSFAIFFLVINLAFPQYKYQQNLNTEKTDLKLIKLSVIPTNVALGLSAGIARFEGNSGMAISLFAEIRTETFSFVPMANYWKTDAMNNFEISGLARLRLKGGAIEPYFDGGIGLNFLNIKTSDKNDTKVGLDLGGGVDFAGVGSNYIIFADAKYKIIVGDPNVKGFTFSGGIKFPL